MVELLSGLACAVCLLFSASILLHKTCPRCTYTLPVCGVLWCGATLGFPPATRALIRLPGLVRRGWAHTLCMTTKKPKANSFLQETNSFRLMMRQSRIISRP